MINFGDMQLKNFKNYTLLSLILITLFGSCVKDKFDAPDNGGCIDEGLQRNITIKDLKNSYTGSTMLITEKFIIEGVVVSSDAEGNFYKQLVIQDETAGISIIIDRNDLHTDFPTGRKVYVNLFNMYMGDYNGSIQIGSGIDPESGDAVRIPQALISDYIFKGPCNQTVEPLNISISQLNPDEHQNMLVKLDYMRMGNNDAGKPYGNPAVESSTNREMLDCNGASITLRTSDFAEFATENTPTGLFSVTAVFNIFGSTKQLQIRNSRDVVETTETCPCEEVTGNVSGTTTYQLDNITVEDDQQNILLSQDFQTATDGSSLNLSGWKNVNENGTVDWEGDSYQQNIYGRASCYQSGESPVVSWLVSPAINISGAGEILSFETKDAYDNGAILEVLISTNHDGGNTPWDANWEKVCPEISRGTTNGFAPNWIVGVTDLSQYTGSVYVAFRYKGGDN